jgi:NAD(P)-dependent dehydrogenase (short-subunit alcohol dehydrogenase family)
MKRNLKELFDLKGKVIILTGSEGLLGKEYKDILTEARANVITVDINPTAKYVVDITSEEQVKSMCEDIINKYGKIDTIINNAVLHHVDYPEDMCRPFEETTLDIWKKALDVNLTGVFLCCREVGKQMIKQGYGNIINISSIYGNIGADQRIYENVPFNLPASYATTKGGILNLTRYLASYWRGKNIRVNCLSPGGVWVEEKHSEEFRDNYAYRTCLGRMADKWDYRGAMLFLCSDASEYMTGANLIVDGGWTAV